ncbi:MAG: Cardiolipin synthetase [Hyphomicrobiales bacterium]|nr:Cardiolipin synthetase [Hyphomicrobiales bacterium]
MEAVGWLLAQNSIIVATLVFAVYVLAFVCAVREVMVSRTSQGSIAWLISLILLPFPTAFLYMVVGWKHFDDYKAVQFGNARVDRPGRTRDLVLVDEETSKRWPVLTQVSQLPFLAGNEAELLIDGQATFDSIFAGFDKATRYLLVQFFIIRDDALGKAFADRLIARAQAGVAVYLLYDDVGCSAVPRSYFDRLRAGGVKVSGFNNRHPFLRLYGPTRINYRNHRKIVVADGEEAWVGGHNVGVEYLGQSKRFGHWRDTQVRVKGPAAMACALVFREDWHWATGEHITATLPEQFATPGEQSVLAMPTGPADRLEDCAIAFTDVIAQAQKRLWIVSPYFVPDLDVRTALYAAVLRGVDVRILLPEKPDHMLVWLASNAHANGMVQHGIEIYRYQSGFLHEKVILVDDMIAGVGTVNFDNRSFAINFELTLWFTHPQMIADVDAMLREDFAYARLTTIEDVKQQSFVRRFIGQAAKLLSPVL